MKEPLFLKPTLQEKMWGGTKLRDEYGYEIPSNNTGECWAISAHPNGLSTVLNGIHKGQTLDQLYQHFPVLFENSKSDVFPLLTKIIDASQALSVQVHPDDAYGLEYEGELGKTECWYIIDAEEGSEIIFGHQAHTRKEFSELVHTGKWKQLLRYVLVKTGDFFFVPSGTIHAVGAGVMILETQQNSDTTYRVYDFDRFDQTGQKRNLHIKQSIEVATIPHVDPVLQFEKTEHGDSCLTQLIKHDYFSVYKWDIAGLVHFEKSAPYTLMSVLQGTGNLHINGLDYLLTKGDHLIIPAPVETWGLDGQMELIASTPGKRNS